MVHRLDQKNSIANKFLAELRDINVQNDRLRFRKNMERLGQIFAYEISKELEYAEAEIETPLGVAEVNLLDDDIVIASILRAGLPLHDGLLSYFDRADNSFIAAYRQHHKDGSFEINMEYVTCPSLEKKVLVVCDPMIASGASMDKTLEALKEYGTPREIHVVALIASTSGLSFVKRNHPTAHIWIGSEDEELTAKSYIVPGLGDAGDLAFGEKLQD